MATDRKPRNWSPSDLIGFGVFCAIVGGVALGKALGQASDVPFCFGGSGSETCTDTTDPTLAFTIAAVALFVAQLTLLVGVIGAGVRIGIREAVIAGTLPLPHAEV
jgi:hypothetical protein